MAVALGTLPPGCPTATQRSGIDDGLVLLLPGAAIPDWIVVVGLILLLLQPSQYRQDLGAAVALHQLPRPHS